jgi:hypothetical protein
MSEGVLTTLIGGITGLVVAVVTSFIIPFVQQRQEKIEEKRSIYEKYAQPLAADAVNLLWRLDEILFKQRGQYLQEDAPSTPFNEYKLISTCYRIAAVLGWIRAIKMEQSYLLFGEEPSVEDLRRAVVSLESALADAPHVEVSIIQNLAELWGIKLPTEPERVGRIAAQIVAEMQHFLSEYELTHYRDLLNIDLAEQLRVVGRITATMSRMAGVPALPETVAKHTCAQALAIIALKQSWIYRDWQQAIGDMMVRPIEGAPRRYDIIGYGCFETLYRAPASLWIRRLQELLVGIDVAQGQPSDFRLDQLRRVGRAVASLVCAIERLDLKRQVLDRQACDLARRFVAELPAVTTLG